jgi:hypothetical protein
VEPSAAAKTSEFQVRPPSTDRSLYGGLPPPGSQFIVEVDGATHSGDHEIPYDWRRDAYSRVEGYRIARVLNDDIYSISLMLCT